MNKNNYIEPGYFHRNYSNDMKAPSSAKAWVDQTGVERLQRVSAVALPFVALYKPLSFPLSLGMGGLRTVNSFANLMYAVEYGDRKIIFNQSIQTTVAVVSLAATVFAHPLGMLITTGQDLLIDLSKLARQVHEGDYKLAAETCLSILNNSLYLALFLHGGLEISIASLGTQILMGLYRAQGEFKAGRYLEGAGHVAMAMIRGNQMSQQIKVLQFQRKMEQLAKKLKENPPIAGEQLAVKKMKMATAVPRADEQLFLKKFKELVAVENFNEQAFLNFIRSNEQFKDQKFDFEGIPRLITPLEYASYKNPRAVIQMIDAGWCNTSDQINTAIDRSFCNRDIIMHLVNKKMIDPNAKVQRFLPVWPGHTLVVNEEITLLGISLQHKDTALTKFLLENKADPNLACNGTDSPLHLALIWSWRLARHPIWWDDPLPDSFQLLLDYGADIHQADRQKSLLYVALDWNPNYVRNLIRLGADVNAKTDSKGRSVLQFAAEKNDLNNIVYFLLPNGADPQYRDVEGNTALHYAARVRPMYSFTLIHLLTAGAKVNDENLNGETPLYLAAKAGSSLSVSVLLSYGANVNTQPSPLEIAIQNKNDLIVQYLRGDPII